MAPRKYKDDSDILKTVHEGAKGLHRHGFINKHRMQEYDALCLEIVPKYGKDDVKRIRRKLNVSQSVLAAVLNTSESAVRQWERGDKNPGGPSSKLLYLLDRKGLEALV